MNLADVYPQYANDAGWGDKGTAHNYLPTYQREITRTHGVTLLEIGVMHGHSIAMWNAWLTDSTVIGLDVDLSRVRFDLPNLHECNAADKRDVQRVLGDATFDYVIDDGDHNVNAQLAVLELFLPRVNPGGAYFIEDVENDASLALIKARLDGYYVDVYDGRAEAHRQPDEILVTVRL